MVLNPGTPTLSNPLLACCATASHILRCFEAEEIRDAAVRVARGRSSAGAAAVSIKFYGLWLGCNVSSLIPHKSPPEGPISAGGAGALARPARDEVITSSLRPRIIKRSRVQAHAPLSHNASGPPAAAAAADVHTASEEESDLSPELKVAAAE